MNRNILFTREHEWIKVNGDKATFGISDYAQEQLGDIVFVELPEDGRQVKVGEVIGVVESVKAVSDVYSPVAGKIIFVNEDLADAPEKINESPTEEGWIGVIELTGSVDEDSFMELEDYLEFCKED